MTTEPDPNPQPQIAVWYFVGATFLFTTPSLLLPDAGLWVRIAFIAMGILAVVGGAAQLRREITRRRDRRDGPPAESDSAPPRP